MLPAQRWLAEVEHIHRPRSEEAARAREPWTNVSSWSRFKFAPVFLDIAISERVNLRYWWIIA